MFKGVPCPNPQLDRILRNLHQNLPEILSRNKWDSRLKYLHKIFESVSRTKAVPVKRGIVWFHCVFGYEMGLVSSIHWSQFTLIYFSSHENFESCTEVFSVFSGFTLVTFVMYEHSNQLRYIISSIASASSGSSVKYSFLDSWEEQNRDKYYEVLLKWFHKSKIIYTICWKWKAVRTDEIWRPCSMLEMPTHYMSHFFRRREVGLRGVRSLLGCPVNWLLEKRQFPK